MGSHIEYRVRYPDAFDVFKPSLPRDDATVLHDADYIARLNNTYDNSILYTDYFLSEVLEAIKGSGRPLATLLYVSDHGEDLYDGGCALTGHGKPTTAGIRVPMLFWRSSAYDRVFPGKIAMLKAHSGERLTTEAVFPLLADAADLHFPSEVASRSVLSESFVPQLQRMVYPLTGSLDFDRAHSNAECLLVD
jgi:glucan phosphoethanolaminetransferase (alkaline phosphatase superfamily)